MGLREGRMVKRICISAGLITFLLVSGSALAENAFDSSRFNVNKGPLKILRITPSGEDVPARRQIVIHFNRPVVPVGRMERRRDEIPITVTPAVKCEWRWLNTSALACQLGDKQKLVPATRYRLVIKPGIKTEDGNTLAETTTHSFLTQRPRVAYSSFYNWKAPGMPEIIVRFNQPVKRKSVAQHVFIETEGGKRVSMQVEVDPVVRKALERARKRKEKKPTSVWGYVKDAYRSIFFRGRGPTDKEIAANAQMSWLLRPTRELPVDNQVMLRVEPGIISGVGPEPGVERRVVVNFSTFPKFSFIGVRCVTNDKQRILVPPDVDDPKLYVCNPLAPKSLVFSAPVTKEVLKQHLHVTPDLADGRKDYDPWERVYVYVNLRWSHRRGRNYTVPLPAGLKAYQLYRLIAKASDIRDIFNRPLAQKIDMRFFTDHRRPDFVLSKFISVLEKSENTHLAAVVTNLNTVSLNYETLTVQGRKIGQQANLPVDQAEDIAYYYPIKIRELLQGRSGAVQGRWTTTPAVDSRTPWNLPRWFFSQVTPFSVHAKIGHHNSLLWVTRLDNGQPVAGARVEVYVGQYGGFKDRPTILAQGRTDREGIVRIGGTKLLDPSLQLLNAWRLTNPRLFVRVTHGQSLALLPLTRDFRVNEYGAQNSYISAYLRKEYGHMRAWGFTAQGVYKVGDTVDYKFFVREQNNRRFIPPPRQGYHLQVTDPAGKVVHEVKDLRLSEFGAYAGKFTIPKTGAVGWYRFGLRAAFTKKRWTPLRVLVSDFTPAPFRVSTDLNGDLFGTGDVLQVTTQARLHAGGPYSNAQTRITARVTAGTLTPSDPRTKGFFFNVYSGYARSRNIHQSQGSVDDKGDLKTEFKIPETKVLYGRLSVESAVRDDRGKYVAGQASARYVGRDRYVGIRQPDWLIKVGQPAKLLTLVVDEKGQITAGTGIQVKIQYRQTTAARVKGAGNAYLTRYEHKWVDVYQCQNRSASSAASCRFTPKKTGYYMFTASIKDTQGRVHASSTSRWALGPGQVLWATPPGNTLQIIPEKKEFKIGETARFLVQNPFPGARALITIERYGIQKSWTKVLNNNAELIEIPVRPDHLPGFYFSVVVMSPRVEKPLGQNQVDLGKPTFRMGYVRVPVKDPYKEIQVTVKPRKNEYKPGARVTVDLKARTRQGRLPRMELAVAVLDESVFDLIKAGKAYFDPYKGFYRLEALDLNNFGLLARIVGRQKFEKKGANTGGGGLMSARKRSGVTRTRSIFKYLSYWKATVRPDAQGRATVSFKAPDNLTGWRVLVVAVTPGDRMGLGDGVFKVNRATEIRPALPNQVTEGDHFTARFTVMNRTKKTRRLTISLRASGALRKRQVKTVTITAEPYKRYTVGLPVKAGRAGKIRFSVRAGDRFDSDAMRLPLTVRKQIAIEAAATYGTTTAKEVSERIKFPKGIRTDVGRVSVVLAPTVIANLEGAFRYLRDYPYISWELILTKGAMAAHYRNLRAYLPKSFTWPGSKGLSAQTLAQAANYQAPNGGMVYFVPRNRYVSPYLSAYTALAFNWLRRDNHAIPAGVERRLHDYLLRLLRQNVFPGFYSRGMGSTVRAVALAALAERGKITLDDVERYRRYVPEMSLFGKAHYLKALIRVGGTQAMQREVMDLIRSHANTTSGKYIFSETLDFAYQRLHASQLRTQCAVLSGFLDFENPKKGGHSASDVPFKLVRTITQGRKQRDRWENTQENMFCMNALVEYSKVYEKVNPNMIISAIVGTKNIGQAQFKDFRDQARDLSRPIQAGDPGRTVTVKLKRQGRGRVYYATRLFYSPARLKTERINSGIEIRREYSVERDGRWVLLETPMKIKTGELVRIDLFVSLPAARNFVVVADPVPGGLEPVNRDLATASTIDADKGRFKHAGGSFWYKYNDWRSYGLTFWSFYYKELRHDSVRFYSEYLPAGNYHLAYVAQAIAPGQFTVMPVHAEEMYDPDVFGQGLPSSLQVEVKK